MHGHVEVRNFRHRPANFRSLPAAAASPLKGGEDFVVIAAETMA
jgi:hypothetical protein